MGLVGCVHTSVIPESDATATPEEKKGERERALK